MTQLKPLFELRIRIQQLSQRRLVFEDKTPGNIAAEFNRTALSARKLTLSADAPRVALPNHDFGPRRRSKSIA